MKCRQKGPRGSVVSFHQLTYIVPRHKAPWKSSDCLTILSNVSGFMTPGMNAIIGPTGCGKSSLLDALAGRKNPKLLSGDVFLDGKLQPAHHRRLACGYVVQDNIAVNMLTVRENIAFSAALRLSDQQLRVCSRQTRVNNVIEELGLSAVADRILGTEFVRGVSGGERKRTCIGIELVKDPLVLYLDEPTTGLDACTAFSVMETLKRLADAGRTIVFSIHQSKYSIYRLFDRLTFLADGQLVYHGPAGAHPLDYFAKFGYLIEGFDNPADFVMDILHGEVPVTMSDEDANEGALRLRTVQDNLINSREAAAAADGRTPLRSNTMSIRDVVTYSLIVLWQQSDTYKRCLTLLRGIASRNNVGGGCGGDGCDGTRLSGVESWPTALAGRRRVDGDQLAGSDPAMPLQPLPFSMSNPHLTSRQTAQACASERSASLPSQAPDASVTGGADSRLPPLSPRSPDPSDVSLEPEVQLQLPRRQSQCDSDSDLPAGAGNCCPRACLSQGGRCFAVSFFCQLCTLNWRQFLSMIRDFKSLFTHFVVQLIVAVLLGAVYSNLDCSLESGIQNRTGLFFFICIQLLFINTSMLETFLKDRVIFIHETSSGFYSVSAYFLAKLVSEVLPTKALPALLFLPITYLMAGLRRSWLAFGFWQLTIGLLTVTASTIAFSVSAMVPNFRLGSTLLSMFFVLMMITSGYLINVLSLGVWLRWLRYLSIIRLSMNTLLINEMVGATFCPTADNSTPSQTPIGNASRTHNDIGLTTDSRALVEESSNWTTVEECISGETFLAMQSIDFGSHWAVWQNHLGVFIVFVLAMLNTYVYLRCMKKYK